MSKTKETVQETEEATQNEVVVVTEKNETEMAMQEGRVGELLKGKTKAGYSLTAEFLEMEDGQIGRFMVMQNSTSEVKTENGEVKEIPCLIMVNEEGRTVRATQTVLVNSIKSNPMPCAVEIVSKGIVKMQGGRKYYDFDVFPLD